MTWSFHLKNGDLNPSGGGFAVVTGTQKLIQDLKSAILEPRGTDPFHPDFGSVLDGGVLPDGSHVDSSIGGVASPERRLAIESEIRRVLAVYQQQQLDRLNQEAILYGGKNTFSAGEILASVNDVTVDQVADVVLVNVSITTQNGDSVSFLQPVN